MIYIKSNLKNMQATFDQLETRQNQLKSYQTQMLLPEIDVQELQRVYSLFNTRRTLFNYISNFTIKKEKLYHFDF